MKRDSSYPIENGWDALFIFGCMAISAFAVTYGLIEYMRWGNARIVDQVFGEDHDPFCTSRVGAGCDCTLERPRHGR